MAEQKAMGCARPTGAVVGEAPPALQESQRSTGAEKEVVMQRIMVGRKAPDFVAPAYYLGGFTSVSLSDLLGKWVLLCFYPGDFTFV